jgi:hypothetical protein
MATNESQPLLNNGTTKTTGSNGKGGVNNSNNNIISWLKLGACVIALLGLGGLIGNSYGARRRNNSSITSSSSSSSSSSTDSTSTTTTPPPPERLPIDSDNPPSNSPRVRPFCKLYGDHLKFAGVLQTSIGDPSQQWSHIPCYAQPKHNNMNFWAPSKDDSNSDVNINGYGVPDAIFRTDFNRYAFPERQPIIGFGAAFTEASSLNYQSLSDVGKERLMELLFGKTGIGYSIGA